jgi:hypothetical protein
VAFACLVIFFLLAGPAFAFRRIQKEERKRSVKLRQVGWFIAPSSP